MDDQDLHQQENLSIFGWTGFPDPAVGMGADDMEPRKIVVQEELSVFGDTYPGVPNPLVGHIHPYPTRFHGPNWNQPMAMQPWREAPYVGVPFTGLGQAQDPLADLKAAVNSPAWRVLSAAGMAVSAYHGYKRNQSVGWALAWGALGALFPVITPVIAVAQGYGKKKGVP